MNCNQSFIENELIILTKQTLDMFLKNKKPGDLIALYTFYYYTAKWQETNQPKCTTGYAAKGLGWTDARVRAIKKILMDMGLIEDIKTVDEGNKVSGWYIKVNYIFSQNTVHPHDFPQGGKSHTVENNRTNALSAVSLNASSTVSLISASMSKSNGLTKEHIDKVNHCYELHKKDAEAVGSPLPKNAYIAIQQHLKRLEWRSEDYESVYAAARADPWWTDKIIDPISFIKNYVKCAAIRAKVEKSEKTLSFIELEGKHGRV